MESLRELAFVSQAEPRVEISRRRPEHEWLLSEPVGLESVCRFESVDYELPLARVYQGVTLSESKVERAPLLSCH